MITASETSPTCPDGLSGQTYGISTKDRNLNPLPLQSIQDNVSEFLYEAEERPQLEFLVTRFGSDAEIAPMFRGHPSNVVLPNRWQLMLMLMD